MLGFVSFNSLLARVVAHSTGPRLARLARAPLEARTRPGERECRQESDQQDC